MDARTGATVLGPTFIPLLPPSVNALYSIIYHQRRVELKPEVLLFKGEFKAFLPKWDIPRGCRLILSCSIAQRWYHANGTLKKADIHNMAKPIQDAVCERYGIDDAWVWTTMVSKAHTTDEDTHGIWLSLGILP